MSECVLPRMVLSLLFGGSAPRKIKELGVSTPEWNIRPLIVFPLEYTAWNIIIGIVNIISSDHPSKDDNVRFTTVPFQALSYQEVIRYINFEN